MQMQRFLSTDDWKASWKTEERVVEEIERPGYRMVETGVHSERHEIDALSWNRVWLTWTNFTIRTLTTFYFSDFKLVRSVILKFYYSIGHWNWVLDNMIHVREVNVISLFGLQSRFRPQLLLRSISRIFWRFFPLVFYNFNISLINYWFMFIEYFYI